MHWIYREIEKMRKEASMSQRELCEKIPMSRKNYQNAINYPRTPPRIVQIEAALELFGYELEIMKKDT